MISEFGQIMTAMVTPFDENLNLDIPVVKSLVKHLEETGTNTIVLGGTTGEGPTITEKEKLILLGEVWKHKLPKTRIIMNVGTNNTKETVENAVKWSNNEKVNGIMVVCPYYNKPSQNGLFKHFEAVDNAVGKPIMVYHIPGRTNVTMTADTMIKIAGLKNVCMLKDAEGDLEKLKLVIEKTGHLWDVYSGDDPALINYLEIGSVGIVSVASHIIGDAITSLIDAYNNGAKDGANDIQEFVKKVSNQLFPPFAPNPVSIKYVLSQMGIVGDLVRLPLTEMNEEEKNLVNNELKKLRVL